MANRVFVPEPARSTILQELHMGHPGKVAMQQRAKHLFFWLHMSRDVEQFAEDCGTCTLHRPRQNTEPLQPRQMPSKPGETVAADFFHLGERRYLVLYDVFSQFPYLQLVRSESTSELARACRTFFQFAGCPRFFWCDRGGAFDSGEFRTFAESLGMQIRHSSVEYPQSNGAAESAVKILKHLAAVSNTEHEVFRAILYLQKCAKRRNTATPAQIFLGRNVRPPLHPRTVKSAMSWERHFQDRIRKQERMRRYYDRTASQVVDDFVRNALVLVHNVCGKSVLATVVGQTGPRTYLVEFENGARSVRNRKFLTSLPRLSRLERTTVQRTTDVSGFPPAIPQPRPENTVTTTRQRSIDGTSNRRSNDGASSKQSTDGRSSSHEAANKRHHGSMGAASKSHVTAKAKHNNNEKRSSRRSHSARSERLKSSGLTVAVEGASRTVQASSSSSRRDRGNLSDYERRRKIRKRDFCRVCRMRELATIVTGRRATPASLIR